MNVYTIEERKDNPYDKLNTEALRESVKYLLSLDDDSIDIELQVFEIRQVINRRLNK